MRHTKVLSQAIGCTLELVIGCGQRCALHFVLQEQNGCRTAIGGPESSAIARPMEHLQVECSTQQAMHEVGSSTQHPHCHVPTCALRELYS